LQSKVYLTDKVANLLRLSKSATCRIANRPTSLFFGLEVSVLEKVNKRRNEIRIDHRLDLIEVAGGDV